MSATDYDEIAEGYAAIADTIPGNALYERPATLALLPSLTGLDVLDAGCGAGFYTEHALRAGAHVVAFDPSAEMVAHTRRRVQDRCEVHHCLADTLPAKIGGKRFDLILSCLVLHYVKNLRREFGLLAALLKPSGQIIVSMKHPLVNQDVIRERGYRARTEVGQMWSCGPVLTLQRPLSDITSAIHAADLDIARMVEAEPLPAMAERQPKQYREAMRIPYFIHFVLTKRPRGNDG